MKILRPFLILSVAIANFTYASLSDERYVELIMKAASTPLCMPEESAIKPSQKEIFEIYKEGFVARQQLFSQPVSEYLPKLYDFWSDTRYTNEVVILRDLDGKEIVERSFYTAVDIQLDFMSGLYFGFLTKGHIGFLWMKGDLDDPIISSSSYKYFWWYEGRRYLPEIWNDWLNCWRAEQRLEKPRKAVEEGLLSEITGYGYHIFPYLYNELRLGDKSMSKVLEEMSKPEKGSWIFEDFPSWWEKNQKNFSFTNPEGYESIKAKLLLGAFPYSKLMLGDMDRWNKNIKKFYADPNNLKENYWYYKISDKDISSEEISEIKQNLKTK